MNRIKKQMEQCNLCPRKCGVNRNKGEKGFCGQTAAVKVARAALHMWEEPCISGTNGSGTVFFSGCTLRCVFCQNYNIAAGNVGSEITIERLAQIFLELQEQGANNINLVTAGHFVPQVVEALKLAKESGLVLPIVFNSSGYEEVETLKLLDGYVDIYLPDFKYVDKEIGQKYSKAKDYFDKAKEAIAEMVRQVGKPVFVKESAVHVAEEGRYFDAEEYQDWEEEELLIMKKGVIVRHLLLPGCSKDSKRVLDYLLESYREDIFISVMNQYTPLPHVASYPELTVKVTHEEYEELLDYAIEAGMEYGFFQEGDTAQDSFIPEFDGEGV